MEPQNDGRVVGTSTKAGALLFAVWGVLHVWVGAEGVHQYLNPSGHGLWKMLFGGASAPVTAYVPTADAVTASVQNHLALNFVIDVGAAGLLGIALAWLIWKRGSWAAYLIAVVIIGVIDNAFLFTQVTPGLIALNAGTVGGPVLWVLASIVTPFGLPSVRRPARPLSTSAIGHAT